MPGPATRRALWSSRWRRTSRKPPPRCFSYSPVLTDADLVDCVASGDVVAQTALARRPNLPPRAKAALAETGQFDAVLALIANVEIDCPAELLHRIFARFGDDASLREALLERPALPAALRARIAVAAAKDLAVEASQWMAPVRAERVAREARDQAICTIASSCRPDERAELTRALRAAGALTPALLLRSLLGGERTLFVARSGGTVGPAAAARRRLYPRAAGGRLRRARPPGWPEGRRPARLSRRARRDQSSGRRRLATGSNCRSCKRSSTLASSVDDPALAKVRALLWRFAAEAAKAEAAQLRPRGGGFGFGRSAPAAPGIFARQRRFRSRAEADRGL